MSSKYKFFMALCDKDGNIIRQYKPEGATQEQSSVKDLEADFNGLVYSKCEGLLTIGAAKNIYEEKYADSEKIRVHVPEVIHNEATTIKLTLFFVGEARNTTRDAFNEYIRGGFHKYWDDARKRMFQFYVSQELPVGEEKWNGSTPYLKCEYTLNNIHGKTTYKETNPFIENNNEE